MFEEPGAVQLGLDASTWGCSSTMAFVASISMTTSSATCGPIWDGPYDGGSVMVMQGIVFKPELSSWSRRSISTSKYSTIVLAGVYRVVDLPAPALLVASSRSEI